MYVNHLKSNHLNLNEFEAKLLYLLIIEKRKGVQIQNEIGKIFRGHNIIEYKSPDDGMTIDDFFKTLGYAFLYIGLGEK